MEFLKVYNWYHRCEVDAKDCPKIGSITFETDFDGSDCNFYPNHEVFGKCKGGTYPLYGKFNIERDYNTNKVTFIWDNAAFASIPGTSYDGKEKFTFPFHIYTFDIIEYLGKGKQSRGTRIRIQLDPLFRLSEDGKRLLGYDKAWLESK